MPALWLLSLHRLALLRGLSGGPIDAAQFRTILLSLSDPSSPRLHYSMSSYVPVCAVLPEPAPPRHTSTEWDRLVRVSPDLDFDHRRSKRLLYVKETQAAVDALEKAITESETRLPCARELWRTLKETYYIGYCTRDFIGRLQIVFQKGLDAADWTRNTSVKEVVSRRA